MFLLVTSLLIQFIINQIQCSMKKHITLLTLWLLISLTMQISAQLVNMNPDPNGEPWWVGGYEITTEEEARLNALPALIPTSESLSTPLPYKIDNSESIWFRPIFDQRGGSCVQASGVGYIFTFMINRMRNLPADDNHPENQYPTHYTFNYLNNGSELNGTLNRESGWDIIRDMGIPNVNVWGGMFGEPTKWMTGYDKYRSALENLAVLDSYPINVSTPEGLNTLKHFLHNYAEGDTVNGGGIVGLSVRWGNVVYEEIPPSSPEEAGKKIVKSWGGKYGHAMTIVGYNDSIKYDFYGEWEYGAVKLANSSGIGYQDDGFVYMPYRLLATSEFDGGISYNGLVEVLLVKESHTPRVTMSKNSASTQK